MRVDAEQTYDNVGGKGKHLDDRGHAGFDKEQNPHHGEGNLLGVFHGDALGHQLAQHQGEVGENQRDEHHGN